MISGLAIHNQLNKKEEKKVQNVQVFVRVRPLSELEINSKESLPLSCDSDRDITCSYKGSSRTYQFDHIFPPFSRQKDIFDVGVRPIADEVLMGFNGTIFVYGQTGTGKTYTMEGKMDNPEDSGIIPRTIDHIFQTLEKAGNDYNVRCSHLEIYKEDIFDLLTCNSQNENRPLNIYDGKVPELEEVVVNDTQSILSILSKSWKRRQTAETVYNKQSSRSHCIFTITVHIKETTLGGEDLIKIGKLNLVDLAGSENAQKSGTSERMREAAVINQSLLTLGRVITALTSDSHQVHIPYRDSKLTRLLQDSLGGKTKTSIIATVSPSGLNIEETVNTLDYALKAKSIRNTPQINQKMSKNSLLKEQSAEIARLKQLLQSAYDKNGVYLSMEMYKNMETTIDSQKERLEVLDLAYHTEKSTNDQLRKQLTSSLSKMSKLEKEFSKFKKEHLDYIDNCQNDDIKLREILNTVMDDLNVYKSKYENMVSLEKENVKNSTATKKQVEQTFGDIYDSTNKMLSENTGFCERMKQFLEQLKLDFGKDLETSSKHIDDIADKLESSQEKLNILSENVLNSIKPLTKMQGDHDQLIDRMEKAINELKESNNEIRDITKKRVIENQGLVGQSFDRCIQLLDRTKENANEVVANQMKSLDQLSSVLAESSSDWIDYIAKQRESKQSLDAKRKERKAALDKKFTQQLAQLISQHTESMMSSYDSYDKCIDGQLSYFEESINSTNEKLTESIGQVRDGVVKIVGEQSNSIADALKQEIDSINVTLNNSSTGDINMLAEIGGNVDTLCQKHMSAIKKTKVQICSKVSQGLKTINQSLLDQQNALHDLGTAKNDARSLSKSLQPSIESNQQQIEIADDLIESHMQSLSQYTEESATSNSNFVSQIPKLFSTKKTERTVKTPSKRDIVLPPKRELRKLQIVEDTTEDVDQPMVDFKASTLTESSLAVNPFDIDLDSKILKKSPKSINNSLVELTSSSLDQSLNSSKSSKSSKTTTTTSTPTNLPNTQQQPQRSRTPVEIIFSPFKKATTKQDISPYVNNTPFIFTGSAMKKSNNGSVNSNSLKSSQNSSPFKASSSTSSLNNSNNSSPPYTTPLKRKNASGRPPSSNSLRDEQLVKENKPEPQPLKRVRVATGASVPPPHPSKPALGVQSKKTAASKSGRSVSSRTATTASSKPKTVNSSKNKENTNDLNNNSLLSFSFGTIPNFN